MSWESRKGRRGDGSSHSSWTQYGCGPGEPLGARGGAAGRAAGPAGRRAFQRRVKTLRVLTRGSKVPPRNVSGRYAPSDLYAPAKKQPHAIVAEAYTLAAHIHTAQD